jgi:hypothetical protein
MIEDRRSKKSRLPESHYNVEAVLPSEIRSSQSWRAVWRTIGALSTNRNDVVGHGATFTGDDQSQRNAFRLIVVAAMQQVHDANAGTET